MTFSSCLNLRRPLWSLSSSSCIILLFSQKRSATCSERCLPALIGVLITTSHVCGRSSLTFFEFFNWKCGTCLEFRSFSRDSHTNISQPNRTSFQGNVWNDWSCCNNISQRHAFWNFQGHFNLSNRFMDLVFGICCWQKGPAYVVSMITLPTTSFWSVANPLFTWKS